MGESALPLTKFLVAARVDRGVIEVSVERIQDQMREMGFSRYFATSAKRGTQIQELRQAIEDAIDWSSLPEINSPQFFRTMKTFLLTEKQHGRLLVAVNDLHTSYLQDSSEAISASNSLIEFTTCIGHLETAGLIQRLSFGDLILLQPEILDAYASALLHAVKDEPDGLGYILIERVYQGDFPIPEEHRLTNPSQERLLLIAMIEDLLRRELALKDESYLIFPSEATRLLPGAPEVRQYSVFFTFTGPTHNIYATLAVRLARSEFFHKQDFWKNAITYRASAGGICGMSMKILGEGLGELALFFEDDTSEQTRFQFEEYIAIHLQRKALPQSIQHRRPYTCPQCMQEMPDRIVQIAKQIGKSSINWYMTPNLEGFDPKSRIFTSNLEFVE